MMRSKTSTPTRSNTVLATDPGFDRLGLAVMCPDLDKPKLLFSQCLETDSKETRANRLLQIGQTVRFTINKYRPQALAIETLFFNTNISSAIGVAEARGVILYEAAQANMEVFEYSPQAIKIAVTGYGRADKIQVSSMVKKLVDLPKRPSPRLDDEIDAIALGITHLATKKGRGTQ